MINRLPPPDSQPVTPFVRHDQPPASVAGFNITTYKSIRLNHLLILIHNPVNTKSTPSPHHQFNK